MATDEIITRYKIELDQLKAEVSQLTAQYGKVDDAADKSAKKTQKAFNDSAKAGNKFSSALSGIATGIVAAFSVQQVLAFAQTSIKAFAEAEKSTEKLKFSVISLGKEGETAFKKLEAQATKFGAGGGKSFFDDDDIKKAQAMFVQFGLTSDQVEKLIPGVIDLAVAMDQDLGSATTTTLSALTGMTRSLKAVGGDFKDTGSVMGNYNKVLEVTAGLNGTAAAALETTSGKLKEQENIAGDLVEAIGARLAPAYTTLKTKALEFLNVFSAGGFGVDVGSIARSVGTLTKEAEGSGATNKADQKEIDAQKKKEAEIAKLKLESLANLSSKELSASIETLKKRDDASRAYVKDEIDRREQVLEKLISSEQKAIEDAKSRREDALKKLQDLELSYSQQRKEALAKDELELIEIKKQTALKQAQDQFNLAGGQSNPSAVSSFEKAKADIEIIFAKETADKKVEIAKEASDEMDKILEDLTKENERLVNIDYANFKKAQDDKAKAAEEAAERIKSAQQEAIQNSIALVGELMNIQENLASQRLVDLEYQREQDRMVADEQQLALQEQLDNRLITQAQYENESAKLKSKRVSSEKDIEKKINEERAKADKAAKDRAIFEAAIAAALSIVKQIAATPLPAGAPFIALVTALGIAQVAAIASRPLPKYAEGTRYLDRNGNKRGKDTIAIMADEGERIIPRKQNVKHWKLYNAIDDGSFDKLIHETYVLPALVAAQKSKHKQKQETFAENIAKSFMASGNKSGNDFYDLRRLWSNGIRVTNLQDIVSDDLKSPYR